MEINAAFCSREREQPIPGLSCLTPVLADLDEHLMTRHWAGQVINLFRQ